MREIKKKKQGSGDPGIDTSLDVKGGTVSMASRSAYGFSALTILMTSLIAGCDSEVITGVLHRDVLLPCHGTYTGAFSLDDLVINWQRSESGNEDVVHCFFYRKDHPEYQKKEYEGRTQLFPEELPKGNASLLLKYLTKSDAGIYTCYYFLHDKEGHTSQRVKLLVQEEETGHRAEKSRPHQRNLVLATAVSLSISAAILIIFSKELKQRKRMWKKKRKRHRSEDEEELLEDKGVPGAIESYRTKLLSSWLSCCKVISPGDEERDDCLSRRIHTSGKKKPISNSYIFEQKEKTRESKDLFTVDTMKLMPRRILMSRRTLMVGEAGIGKSYIAKAIQKHWASGQKDAYYKCVIYLTFNELNAFKKPLSVRELLGSKCQELSKVLTVLLKTEQVLIILDGLDEFNDELEDSLPDVSCDIDTALAISTLVSKVLSQQLLPNTDVLVTSPLSSVHKLRESFTSTFILEAFTEKQIREYCEKCIGDNKLSELFMDFVTTQHLSSLVSIPLLSSILCEIYKKGNFSQYEEVLTMHSRMMFSLLQISLRDTLRQTGGLDPVGNTGWTAEESKLPENIENTLHRLCEISYENLMSGVQEIKSKYLGAKSSQTKLLLEHFSEFLFTRDSNGENFKYRHTSIRDMFAALYYVRKIQDENELKKRLDACDFGKISQDLMAPLDYFPYNDRKKFWTVIQFFFGLLPYGNSSFLSKPLGLSEEMKDVLKRWFRAWIEPGPSKIDFLNLLHCVSELHDDDVKEDVSRCIQNINLFNIPLNSLDIRALRYCCQSSKQVDLRLCVLQDEGLEQLQDIIRNCEEAWLSSNQLTEKSGKILGDLLKHEHCTIEVLALGTNDLGTAGIQHLFRGLEKNKSLNILYLNDNNIDDFGTQCMAQSLEVNKTLQELHLCMNSFEDSGIQTLKELKKRRPELRIVRRIAEEQDVLYYAEEKVERLASSGWNQNETDSVQQFLKMILRDLQDKANIHESLTGRVETLTEKVSKMLQEMQPK